mmetsp:Transcript_1201/g.4099  ORF Transcript_1201/g.4099 Transcript_1201/m.4099 type:complete len:409 (-) Transcript_1201:153-1379(-)
MRGSARDAEPPAHLVDVDATEVPALLCQECHLALLGPAQAAGPLPQVFAFPREVLPGDDALAHLAGEVDDHQLQLETHGVLHVGPPVLEPLAAPGLHAAVERVAVAPAPPLRVRRVLAEALLGVLLGQEHASGAQRAVLARPDQQVPHVHILPGEAHDAHVPHAPPEDSPLEDGVRLEVDDGRGETGGGRDQIGAARALADVAAYEVHDALVGLEVVLAVEAVATRAATYLPRAVVRIDRGRVAIDLAAVAALPPPRPRLLDVVGAEAGVAAIAPVHVPLALCRGVRAAGAGAAVVAALGAAVVRRSVDLADALPAEYARLHHRISARALRAHPREAASGAHLALRQVLCTIGLPAAAAVRHESLALLRVARPAPAPAIAVAAYRAIVVGRAVVLADGLAAEGAVLQA